jgi:hypothetical protein
MTPNERGHYPITPMQVELGLWRGIVLNQPEQLWLRWWDLDGNLLLTGHEQAERERQEKEQALQQLEQERQKRHQLAQQLKSLTPEQLQALGIDPEMLE